MGATKLSDKVNSYLLSIGIKIRIENTKEGLMYTGYLEDPKGTYWVSRKPHQNIVELESAILKQLDEILDAPFQTIDEWENKSDKSGIPK